MGTKTPSHAASGHDGYGAVGLAVFGGLAAALLVYVTLTEPDSGWMGPQDAMRHYLRELRGQPCSGRVSSLSPSPTGSPPMQPASPLAPAGAGNVAAPGNPSSVELSPTEPPGAMAQVESLIPQGPMRQHPIDEGASGEAAPARGFPADTARHGTVADQRQASPASSHDLAIIRGLLVGIFALLILWMFPGRYELALIPLVVVLLLDLQNPRHAPGGDHIEQATVTSGISQ